MKRHRPHADYRDSGIEWLSDDKIPASWETIKLGLIARFKSGDAIDSARINESGEYPVYGGGGFRGYTDSFNVDAVAPMIGRQGALCGKVWIGHGKVYATEHAIVAYSGRRCDPEWLRYILSVMDLGQYSTSAAQPGISVETVASKRVPVPSLPEQRAIADYLDRETAQIDAFIAKNEDLITLLTERRAAVIAHAVTRGIDASAPLAASGVEWLGDVPSHWSVQRLASTVARARNGVWGADPEGGGEDLRCVRVADFDRPKQRIHDDAHTLRKLSASERAGRVLRNGDLLLEKSGGGEKSPVGFVVLYDRDEPAVCSNFVARVELRAGMDPQFWTYVHGAMYRLRITEKSLKQSTGIQNLDQSAYFNEYVAVPPYREQCAIAEQVERRTAEIDAAVGTARHSVALARERRAALISAAVTGKIDVGVAV
ncbi:restriction endonuclease subunit S [Microbacterium sp. NPDC055910]|uniref:restriction endonuclease subunit S n=1 Tax=Microbacterium sp. NPDC055910 TaxID=3345659 RepID=UPI0035D96643